MSTVYLVRKLILDNAKLNPPQFLFVVNRIQRRY